MFLVVFCSLNFGVCLCVCVIFFLLDFFHLHCKYLFILNTKAIETKMGVQCIELGLLTVRLLDRTGGEQAVMGGPLHGIKWRTLLCGDAA